MSNISGSLAENILTVLCFDDKAHKLISGTLDTNLIDSPILKDIANKAIDFINMYGNPPKEHIYDLLEHKIEHDKNKDLYELTLKNVYNISKSINTEYVISSFSAFVRKQQLKRTVTEAAQLISGDKLDEADNLIRAAAKAKLELFDPGLSILDLENSLSFLDNSMFNFIPLGINGLDEYSIGPTPKELMTVVAPTGRGKSWFLIHIGKMALLQRKKVLHITLEMSKDKTMMRYMQSLFSVNKRNARQKITNLEVDELNRFTGFNQEYVNRPSLEDDKIKEFLIRRIKKNENRLQLYVKEFPTGSLTISGLISYLDTLESQHNYIPDVIVIDYADLMHLDTKNLRIETGQLYKELRGIATDRNLSVCTASQTNKEGEDTRWVTLKHLSEDFSKNMTSDIIITYNQTSYEKSSGLARLLPAKVRNDESRIPVLISQNYGIGQFCLQSVKMCDTDSYFDIVKSSPPVEEAINE